MNSAELAGLFENPADAGRRAQVARQSHFGRRVVVRSAPAHAVPAIAAVLRGPEVALDLAIDGICPEGQVGDPGWPAPGALRTGDRLVVQVDRGRVGAYFEYLIRLATEAPDELGFSPVCALAGGLFRLHLIAAARIALPGRVRVEARHDLLGIRLAQVALGFGADTLAGPLTAGRKLPLAGVPRPDEATPAGLAALVERAGLEPVFYDMTLETLP